jgi:hypothetical protein
MDERKRKYKVGDRVVYLCDTWSGNADLNGRSGTVIGVYGTTSPYTVEFDDELPDAMEERRFGGKKGHCWCCTESHLISDENTNEKEKETMGREYVKWTDEEDAKLLSMKSEGKTNDEMASELKKTPVQCYKRLYYMQKVNGKFGITNKTEPSAVEMAEATNQTDEPPKEEQKGDLNDLEKVLSEIINEQKAEIDQLNGCVKDLENKLVDTIDEKTDLQAKIVTLVEDKENLIQELHDTASALEKTEEYLDNEREAMRNASVELEKAKSVEDDFKRMVESYAAEAEEYKKRLEEVNEKYEKMNRELSVTVHGKDSCIEKLKAENKRLTKLIIDLTEERIASHES